MASNGPESRTRARPDNLRPGEVARIVDLRVGKAFILHFGDEAHQVTIIKDPYPSQEDGGSESIWVEVHQPDSDEVKVMPLPKSLVGFMGSGRVHFPTTVWFESPDETPKES
jgi:hypothetical protein